MHRTTSRWLVIVLSIGNCFLALYAARLPWLEWNVPNPFPHIDHTNVFWILPMARSGVLTVVGATRLDGIFALTLGWAARGIIIFILLATVWLLKKQTKKGWFFALTITSPPLCCFFDTLLWYHFWVIDEVQLYNHPFGRLPTISNLEWKGPILLTISLLAQIIIIREAKRTT